MSRVYTEEGHLYLTARQVRLLSQGKYVRLRRNGSHLTIKMQNRDQKVRKIEVKILKLKTALKALRNQKKEACNGKKS